MVSMLIVYNTAVCIVMWYVYTILYEYIFLLLYIIIIYFIYTIMYKAAVLPRILPLPGTRMSMDEVLGQLEYDLDYLLSNKANITIDNAPPLYFGFSHGHTLC